MNHKTYREWIPLYLYDELTPEQRNHLSQHLRECNSCAVELKELETMQSKLDPDTLTKPSEELLQQARSELRVALRIERSKKTAFEKISERFHVWIPYLQFAAGAAAMLIVGILVGRYAFMPEPQIITQRIPSNEPRQEQFDRGEAQIVNVKFEDADAQDGTVAFSFQTITPLRVRGNINDPQIQKVLTYAVVNEQNPGVRLNAVNALSSNQNTVLDPDVKNALIYALKADENPGVRKEALTTLQSFPMDQDIKGAFLHVLVHDDNAGLRVAAMKSVVSQNMKDPETVSVLQDRSRSDAEPGIRVIALKALEEVSQQQ